MTDSTLQLRLCASTVAVGAAVALLAGSPAAAGEKLAADLAPAPIVAEVGEPAPDFALSDTEGVEHRLSDYRKDGKIVVLEWFNPDCPFVQKHHKKNKTMASTFGAYHERNVVWLAINSGGPGKQGHGLKRNQKARADYDIEYPLLLDEDGAVGRLYAAKTTPHMYVISKTGELLYAGAIDDNRSAGKLGELNYVSTCLDQILAEETVEIAQTKPYGCTVKYASAKSIP